MTNFYRGRLAGLRFVLLLVLAAACAGSPLRPMPASPDWGKGVAVAVTNEVKFWPDLLTPQARGLHHRPGAIGRAEDAAQSRVRLHDTHAGRLLGSQVASARTVDELDTAAQKAAELLFAAK